MMRDPSLDPGSIHVRELAERVKDDSALFGRAMQPALR